MVLVVVVVLVMVLVVLVAVCDNGGFVNAFGDGGVRRSGVTGDGKEE